MNKPFSSITVTRAVMPPLEEYVDYLTSVWSRSQLPNYEPLVQQLEQDLNSFLDDTAWN